MDGIETPDMAFIQAWQMDGLSNTVQYKISGASRRSLKKKMNELKRMARMHHYYNDINIVYGCGMNDEQSKTYLEKIDKEVKKYEILLNETI